MKRGVMQLLQDEIREALNCLPEVSITTPLYSKFQSALNIKNPRVAIQFDTNELELILDNLGAPLMDDIPLKKSLRKKIQTFLFFLRNEALKIKD